MKKQDLTYQIQHTELGDGEHQFDFQTDDRIISRFENEEIRNTDLSVSAILERKSDDFILILDGKGSIELQCDRCLDFFTRDMNLHHEVSIQLAEETNFDTDEEFVTLSKSDNYLDIAYFIYEMIILDLPIRRVHPEDENGNSMCNPDVIKFITGESQITEEERKVIDSDQGNENWKDDLKNLLNN